jgi:hypothetical protein
MAALKRSLFPGIVLPPAGLFPVVSPLVALFLVVWLPLTGCSSISEPGPTVSDSVYVEVLVDLHLLQARFDEGVPFDSTLRPVVLQNHGVTEEDLDQTTRFYSDHQEEFLTLYNRVIDRISEEQRTIE